MESDSKHLMMENLMTEPVIAARRPQKTPVKEGEDYFWCACGRSAGQPFCDGSHRGTGMKPMKFTAEETGDAFLCLCKLSIVILQVTGFVPRSLMIYKISCTLVMLKVYISW